MDELNQEQIAHEYLAMLDSVGVINAVIAGQEMEFSETPQKKACVQRNVRHLEAMRSQTYWTTEDMAPVDAAIISGTAFVSA